jgi:lysophospholipase L1-like esterase
MRTPLPARARRPLLLAVGLLVVAALVVTGVLLRPGGPAATSAAAAPSTPSSTPTPTEVPADGDGTYLALGDSVPFGFRNNDMAHFSQPASFTGYPELLAPELGLRLLNASCPGETTASFSDTTARAFGCENSPQSPQFGYRAVYPLHVPYRLPESQLDYAVQTLQATKDVRLVTLQLGANDAFLCRATTADRCASEAATVVAAARRNVDTILTALRDRAGYTGKVVVVTYYALDYSDAAAAASTHLLDDALAAAARAHGAAVADGFAAFRPAATAAGGSAVDAGLVIRGDVHPTPEGQRLLAAAVRSALGG